jgi:hypothetical protein
LPAHGREFFGADTHGVTRVNRSELADAGEASGVGVLEPGATPGINRGERVKGEKASGTERPGEAGAKKCSRLMCPSTRVIVRSLGTPFDWSPATTRTEAGPFASLAWPAMSEAPQGPSRMVEAQGTRSRCRHAAD